jgi:hypothetical protein
MNIAKSIHGIVNEILIEYDSHIQGICEKIRKNISKYDDATLDLIDEYIKSNILEMNEVITGSGLISTNGGVRPSNNELIEYENDILSFNNDSASKKERHRKIPYLIITLFLFSIVATCVYGLFFTMAISDTIGAENIMPILKKFLLLDATAVVDLISSGTMKRINDINDIEYKARFARDLLGSGLLNTVAHKLDIMYRMFQATDAKQHLAAITANINKINYAFYWFRNFVGSTISLAVILRRESRKDALTYIVDTRRISNINKGIKEQEDIVAGFILDETTSSSGRTKSRNRSKSSKQLMIKQDGGNKHKKNKTKKNKTKKN